MTLAVIWPDAEVDGVALVDEGGVLGGYHFQVGGDTGLVMVAGEGRRALVGGRSGVLLDGLVGEDAQRREVVLDVLEGGQHVLTVARHGGVVVDLRSAIAARRRPASKTVARSEGPSDQKRFGIEKSVARVRKKMPVRPHPRYSGLFAVVSNFWLVL